MRTNCRGRRGVGTETVGPQLRNQADAVAALRLSVGSPEERSVVVLVCDAADRIVLAVDFAGAGVMELARLVELVALAQQEPRSVRLVIGIFREGRSSMLDDDETAAVATLGDRCRAAGVGLREVIVLAGHRWRSVTPWPPGCPCG